MQRRANVFILLITILLTVGLLSACVAPAPAADSGAATDSAATDGVAEEAAEETASDESGGDTVLFFAPAELSGAGATVGNNWADGVALAVEDINAAGGILEHQIEVVFEDTQSDPATSKAVIAKGLEMNPYAIVGPLYSGSIIVNMVEAQRAEVTQIVGGEAANLTQQGNPYIFRTSFGQATSMPKLANYMDTSGIGSVDIIWINNEFGKGGRDAIAAELEARGISVVNDISAEEQQADFAPEALTVLGSDAEALFIYLNEEESARLLTELSNQGFEKPIFGETTLIAQSTIDLAGEAANGAQGHVGLTASAPVPAIEEYAARFEEKYGYAPDHNGLKGYIAMHVLKEITERIGEFDTKQLAEQLHCTTITTEDEPGVLLDIVFDENGDVDRESFLVEVQDGQQVITQVLPRLGTTCGEQ